MTATMPLTSVQVEVAECLRLDVDLLPGGAWKMIRDALEFPNPEREQAMRERVWNAHQMPAKLKMWEHGRLPRGFAGQLEAGLKFHGMDVQWVDGRADVPVYTKGWKRVKLRDYQEPACVAMEAAEQGIWQAPPASGKTVTVLELVRRVGQRAIVITNKTEIAYQWRDRAKQFLGIDVGILGDGGFQVRDVTIALQQTLWSRKDELDEAGFWQMFGLVCLDECHHLQARTFMDTVQRFNARYRLGVSGTPERAAGTLPFMEAAVGPIFHVTPKEALVTAGIIAQPCVQVVKTAFEFPYHQTHDNRPGQSCGYEGCRRSSRTRVHRNNYTAMIESLVTDASRNALIATKIAESKGRAQLVLSRRLAHLDELRERAVALGVDPDSAILFTGRQSGEERVKIVERAAEGDVVLFSTIADEALDIPRLDTIHLAYPAGNVEIVKQQIGRIERVHPAKGVSVVFDYMDVELGVLRQQFWRRWRGIYSPERMRVEGLENVRQGM